MDLPRYIFRINDDEYDDLKCLICFEIYQDPVEDDCIPVSHNYCKKCIETWIRKTKNCPMSKKSLNLYSLKKNKKLEDQLGELEVECIFKEMGCKWEGLMKYYKEHL